MGKNPPHFVRSTTSPGAPSFAVSLSRVGPANPTTEAGAPYLDSEMWASCEARPHSSLHFGRSIETANPEQLQMSFQQNLEISFLDRNSTRLDSPPQFLSYHHDSW